MSPQDFPKFVTGKLWDTASRVSSGKRGYMLDTIGKLKPDQVVFAAVTSMNDARNWQAAAGHAAQKIGVKIRTHCEENGDGIKLYIQRTE